MRTRNPRTASQSLRPNDLSRRCCGRHQADYTVMGMEFAENLLLISRASSDAYEPYVFLKGHSEKSSNPDGQNDLL